MISIQQSRDHTYSWRLVPFSSASGPEDELQTLIEEHPEIVPSEELQLPSSLKVLGREVPTIEGKYIDHLTIDFHIEFADAAIGQQDKTLNMANGAFVHELCDSRTFCLKSDVDKMRDQGLIVGGDLNSALVVDGDVVITPGGMRHADEPVRHKMLDALGDLALAGAPILGHYTGYRAGHSITNRLLREVFADPTAYRIVQCDRERASTLPGAGLQRADRPALVA